MILAVVKNKYNNTYLKRVGESLTPNIMDASLFTEDNLYTALKIVDNCKDGSLIIQPVELNEIEDW